MRSPTIALWLLDLEPNGNYIEYPAVEFDRADNVDLQDDTAFVGKGREDATGRGFYLLQVLEVAAGNQAEVVGEIELDLGFDADPQDLPQTSGDGWVAVASGNYREGRLGVFDVSEAPEPILGTTIPFSRRPSQMIAVDDLLHLLIGNGLIVVDVSDPHDARPIGGFEGDSFLGICPGYRGLGTLCLSDRPRHHLHLGRLHSKQSFSGRTH